ncbi:MoxR-like ATPase [Povalibacter uvarum]|uniref:MoxR-like ATPase n=1 Tax=Povalibacter uvarum TaxID=732238 RepID=A0A841HF95_9GAMM|nr:MoxR family ATPase [Povalibacter uvarum]MBB6091436.1 MoxR-like ATPase [Povalibacter uvarum]
MESPVPTLITQADPVELIGATIRQLGKIILGKEQQLRLSISCLLARGHLLIEDIPGVGKTTLAHALAETLGLHYQRIQFTSDLLPADIIGVSIFERDSGEFRFHKGPIFSQLVLADEVNRATPKAQSALLEAMEEHQVTVDGQTYPLAAPFFVIATQNPVYQIGTFPLPESQLDRFLLRIELGYPDSLLERELLTGQDRRDLLATIPPMLTPQQLLLMQTMVPRVHASDALLDYVQAIIRYTRESRHFESGLSPRAGIAMLRAAQAWALIHGHAGVLPEDVQAVLPGVVGHRLKPRDDSSVKSAAEVGELVLKAVAVP